MKTFTGQQLVEILRRLCDKAAKRLWIASPFIGHWSSVRRILGRKWVDDAGFSVRLVTDFLNINNFNYETIKCFHDRGLIKEIKGLHAKIYIIDNDALVTSANLTNTAFTKRHEVGVFLFGKEAKDIIKLYEYWWEKVATAIPSNYLPKIAHKRIKTEKEETVEDRLDILWHLLPDPGDPGKTLTQRFLDYEAFRNIYKDFANTYAKIQRIWPDRHLYFETDSFLNYLFHHATGLPTKKYSKIKPRQLTDKGREREIERCAALFKKWISNGADGVETIDWRKQRSKTIKRLLSKKNIDRLNEIKVKQVVDCLNCMNSMPLMKFKFLNPQNNNLETIKLAWKELLYGRDQLLVRMNNCAYKLRYFGRSSIHEILGNIDPQRYPLRNTNSNSGLRFFGYDVSAY